MLTNCWILRSYTEQKKIIFLNSTRTLENSNIELNGHGPEQVQSVNYLGVYLDEIFNFKGHIQFVSLKTAKFIGLINCIKIVFRSHLKF